MYVDREQQQEKLDGLIQNYREGRFSTVVFTASLKGMRLSADEIGDLVCQHIFVHQASLPYLRGDFR